MISEIRLSLSSANERRPFRICRSSRANVTLKNHLGFLAVKNNSIQSERAFVAWHGLDDTLSGQSLPTAAEKVWKDCD